MRCIKCGVEISGEKCENCGFDLAKQPFALLGYKETEIDILEPCFPQLVINQLQSQTQEIEDDLLEMAESKKERLGFWIKTLHSYTLVREEMRATKQVERCISSEIEDVLQKVSEVKEANVHLKETDSLYEAIIDLKKRLDRALQIVKKMEDESNQLLQKSED